jgi:hypothetical protein
MSQPRLSLPVNKLPDNMINKKARKLIPREINVYFPNLFNLQQELNCTQKNQ